jgi:hypothetical protein
VGSTAEPKAIVQLRILVGVGVGREKLRRQARHRARERSGVGDVRAVEREALRLSSERECPDDGDE